MDFVFGLESGLVVVVVVVVVVVALTALVAVLIAVLVIVDLIVCGTVDAIYLLHLLHPVSLNKLISSVYLLLVIVRGGGGEQLRPPGRVVWDLT